MGVVSSNPTRVIIKTPLATGNHLIKSTSLEKLRAVSLVSAKLEIEYAMQLNISTALACNPKEEEIEIENRLPS